MWEGLHFHFKSVHRLAHIYRGRGPQGPRHQVNNHLFGPMLGLGPILTPTIC